MTPQIEHQLPGITIVLPSAALARYVKAYYVFDWNSPPAAAQTPLNFPTGSVDLWIHFGDRPQLANRHGILPSASVIGLKLGSDQYVFESKTRSLQIEFHPAGAVVFFKQPLHEFTNHVVDLNCVWPSADVRAIDGLAELALMDQIAGLEALLIAQFDPRWKPVDRVLAGVDLIRYHWGVISVRALADQLNISTSQLERSFAAQLGTTPKHFARMIRFYGVVLHLHQRAGQNFAELAVKHGYADQAHFNHEFVEFSGLTPSEFLRIIPNADFLQDKWDTYE